MSSTFRRPQKLAATTLVLSTLGSMAAHSQTASQITPHSFAPAFQSRLGGGFSTGLLLGLETPPGAEKLYVTLAGIKIDGAFARLGRAEAGLRAKLVGKRVSGAALFAAARELETAYAKAGYVLVRIVLPPQSVHDGGTLRLQVIDGYIDRIDTKAVPERVRHRIEEVLRPLNGKRGMILGELERRLLLAGDTPGVTLKSTLAPSAAAGATVLIITAKYKPIDTTLSADNSLAKSLGRTQASIGVNFNSLAGTGEQAYLHVSGSPTFGDNGFPTTYPRNRALAAGIIAPIGIDGLTWNVEATETDTTPLSTTGVDSTDQFQRVSVRLRYPWVRSRDWNFASQAIFDAQDEQQSLLTDGGKVGVSLDRLRIIRLANDADYLTPWGGSFFGTATASFGIDALGARSAADATAALPLSHQGANAGFNKVEASVGYRQSLAEHLAVNWSTHGQFSFGQALASSEEFGIAGPGSVSAYDSGSLSADSGVVMRTELTSPFAEPKVFHGIIGVMSPYVFGAIGALFRRDPTAVEVAHEQAASFGVGLRVDGTGPERLLSIEYARQIDAGSHVPRHNGDRITLAASLRF